MILELSSLASDKSKITIEEGWTFRWAGHGAARRGAVLPRTTSRGLSTVSRISPRARSSRSTAACTASRACSSGSGITPCPTFEPGLRNLRLLDAVVESYHKQGAEVVVND